jgi:hypothetical protein
MKKGWLMMGLLVTGCFGGGDRYDLDALSDAKVSVNADGRRVLSFRVRQESLYACPGVRREKRADGDYFTVVRCAVGKECPVDFPATAAPTGEEHSVTLPDDTAAALFLSGTKGSRATAKE